MKVEDISRTKRGTQIVVSSFNKHQKEPEIITSTSKYWPRFKAMSNQLKQEHLIKGKLISIDVKHFVGALTQYQFSFKEEKHASLV